MTGARVGSYSLIGRDLFRSPVTQTQWHHLSVGWSLSFYGWCSKTHNHSASTLNFGKSVIIQQFFFSPSFSLLNIIKDPLYSGSLGATGYSNHPAYLSFLNVWKKWRIFLWRLYGKPIDPPLWNTPSQLLITWCQCWRSWQVFSQSLSMMSTVTVGFGLFDQAAYCTISMAGHTLIPRGIYLDIYIIDKIFLSFFFLLHLISYLWKKEIKTIYVIIIKISN